MQKGLFLCVVQLCLGQKKDANLEKEAIKLISCYQNKELVEKIFDAIFNEPFKEAIPKNKTTKPFVENCLVLGLVNVFFKEMNKRTSKVDKKCNGPFFKFVRKCQMEVRYMRN